MKIFSIAYPLLLGLKKLQAGKISNADSIYKDAKCVGNSIRLLKNDDTWSTFPCAQGYQCTSANGSIQCTPTNGPVKISTVTITLPSNINPTVTIKHPSHSPAEATPGENKYMPNNTSTSPQEKAPKELQPEKNVQISKVAQNPPQSTPSQAPTDPMAPGNMHVQPPTTNTNSGSNAANLPGDLSGNNGNTALNSPSSANMSSPSGASSLNSMGATPTTTSSAMPGPTQGVSSDAPGTSNNAFMPGSNGSNIVIEYKDSGRGDIDFKIPTEFNNYAQFRGSPSGDNKTQAQEPATSSSILGSREFSKSLNSSMHNTSGSQNKLMSPGSPSAPISNPAVPNSKPAAAKALASTKAASSAAPSGNSSALTMDHVKQTLTACGYGSGYKQDFVAELISQINKQKWDNNEKSMFLAQVYHESGGLSQIIEQACVSSPCTNYDNTNKANGPVVGAPGKHYFGRGYIQLSWPSNYKDASNSIYKDDRLYTNPDQVATDKSIAAAVSIWYWNARVMTSKSPLSNFGETTKAINGALECGKGQNTAAKRRWTNYQKIAKVLGVTQLASEGGCY